jgi:hypothetical protein
MLIMISPLPRRHQRGLLHSTDFFYASDVLAGIGAFGVKCGQTGATLDTPQFHNAVGAATGRANPFSCRSRAWSDSSSRNDGSSHLVHWLIENGTLGGEHGRSQRASRRLGAGQVFNVRLVGDASEELGFDAPTAVDKTQGAIISLV